MLRSRFPRYVGKEATGIHDKTFHSMLKCDVDIRGDPYAKVEFYGCHSARLALAYRDLTEHLMKILTEQGYPLTKNNTS